MAKRSQDVPQDPGYVPYQPPEVRVIHRLAENGEIVAYTDEEYGVRKDDGLGVVKPVSSARGLLFMALFVSALDCLVLYGLVRIAIDGTWEILAETWWVLIVGVFVAVGMLELLPQGAPCRKAPRRPQPVPARRVTRPQPPLVRRAAPPTKEPRGKT